MVKKWLVVGGGDKYLAGRGLWLQNYGWSWVFTQFSNIPLKHLKVFTKEFSPVSSSDKKLFIQFPLVNDLN